MTNIHLSQTINWWVLNAKHVQSGILNKLMKKPPNLRNYRQLKALIDIIQRFLSVYW